MAKVVGSNPIIRLITIVRLRGAVTRRIAIDAADVAWQPLPR